MSGRPGSTGGYVRALGPHLGVALYDPVVALTMRQRTFRSRMLAQVLDGGPATDSLEVGVAVCAQMRAWELSSSAA